MKTNFVAHSASLALLSAIAASGVHAASLAWNPGNTPGGTVTTPTGSGGAGNWNTASALWSNSTGNVAWNNANNDSAILGGTGGTVALGENITVNDLTFGASGYTVSGSFTLTVNGVISTSQTNTISARIGGVDLTKTGTGTLVLQNSGANTYTGNTYIQSGILQTRNSGALASTTIVNISSGGTLDLRASQTVAGLSGTGTVNQSQTTGTTTLTVNAASGSTFDGVLKDGTAVRFLALTKSGGATLTLTGTNTQTGATTVNGGTLATGATGTFGAGDVTVASGATLSFGNNASIGDLSGLTFASGSSIGLNFSGVETVGSVFNSVSSTFLAEGTYNAASLNSFFGVSTFTGTGSLSVSAIPEPSAFAMLAGFAALICGGALRRRRS